MGKLNIAHHKSYHPYRRDNIERVRRDEEEASIKEAQEEGRMALADAEARISLLRERAGVTTSAKGRRREDEKRERELLRQATDPDARAAVVSSSSTAGALGNGKHINLFEDLEQSEIASAISRTKTLDKVTKGKGKDTGEADKGIPLAPSAKDLNPWYSEKTDTHFSEQDEGKRNRDLSHKSRSDPLTAIQRELESRFPSTRNFDSRTSRSSGGVNRMREWSSQPSSNNTFRKDASGTADPARAARESRESSERARAQALKARRAQAREAAGSATPSTIRGGNIDDDRHLYGNQFNARAVAEAHHRRHSRADKDDQPTERRDKHRRF